MENKEQVTKPEIIVVDDGYEEVQITNLRGDVIGKLIFQPDDVDIINRFNDMIDSFDQILEPFKKVVRTEGMSDTDFFNAQWSAIEEAKQLLFDAFDETFGGNFSEAFFGNMNPFSPVKGQFYCYRAITAAGQYLTQRFHREVKKLHPKTEQYIHGYRSGKHRNGNRNRGGKR